jgi:RNA polymerase sigma-70 factor (ECF subfamily)
MVPKLYRTCKRYLKKEEEIEELADAFYTISQTRPAQRIYAFEAWSRKITVNHCLATIKKKHQFQFVS